MKKSIFSLFTLLVLSSCRGPLKSSENIKVNTKVDLSIASTALTEKQETVFQNNPSKVEKTEAKKRRNNINYLGDDNISDETEIDVYGLEITEVETPYSILENGESSFDLVISGLSDGEFNVVITTDDKDKQDVTDDFVWIYKRITVQELAYYVCKFSENERSFQNIAWEKSYFIDTKDDVEYRSFRIYYIGEEPISAGFLVHVSQNNPPIEANGAKRYANGLDSELVSVKEGSLIVKPMDFNIRYIEDNVTDLNNLYFSIESDRYELLYTAGGDEWYDEASEVSLSIDQHQDVPYELIRILYRELGETEWKIVSNYPIVFPFINNHGMDDPKFGFSHGSGRPGMITVGENKEPLIYLDKIKMFSAFNWTGIKKDNFSIIFKKDGFDNFVLPLVISDSVKEYGIESFAEEHLRVIFNDEENIWSVFSESMTHYEGYTGILVSSGENHNSGEMQKVLFDLGTFTITTGLPESEHPIEDTMFGYFAGTTQIFK